MTGKERFEEQGFKLTLSSEFSDIFEKYVDLTNDKIVVVFDKKSLEVLFEQTNQGIATAWFMPNDFYIAVYKHCEDLGW